MCRCQSGFLSEVVENTDQFNPDTENSGGNSSGSTGTVPSFVDSAITVIVKNTNEKIRLAAGEFAVGVNDSGIDIAELLIPVGLKVEVTLANNVKRIILLSTRNFYNEIQAKFGLVDTGYDSYEVGKVLRINVIKTESYTEPSPNIDPLFPVDNIVPYGDPNRDGTTGGLNKIGSGSTSTTGSGNSGSGSTSTSGSGTSSGSTTQSKTVNLTQSALLIGGLYGGYWLLKRIGIL